MNTYATTLAVDQNWYLSLLFVILLLIASKAIEHFSPRQFFRAIGLLRRTNRWNPLVQIDQWKSIYITDDSEPVYSRHNSTNQKTLMTSEDVEAMYAQFLHLRPPYSQLDDPISLYKVTEIFDIMLCGRYRIGWSLNSSNPRRMRIWGQFDEGLCLVSGHWDDHERGTKYRGHFVSAFDDGIKRGVGSWIGKSREGTSELRTYPWIWEKEEPKPSPLNVTTTTENLV